MAAIIAQQMPDMASHLNAIRHQLGLERLLDRRLRCRRDEDWGISCREIVDLFGLYQLIGR